VLAPINELARDYGLASILLHHASRATGEYRDSTAIGAKVDVILEMDSGTMDDQTLRRIKARGRFPVDSFSIRLTDNGYMLADATRPRARQTLAKTTVGAPWQIPPPCSRGTFGGIGRSASSAGSGAGAGSTRMGARNRTAGARVSLPPFTSLLGLLP